MRHMEEMKIAGLAMALCIVMLGIYIVVPKDGTISHLTAIPDNNAAQPVTDSTSQESADSGSDEYFPIYTQDSYNSESDPDYSYDNTDSTDNTDNIDNGASYTDGSNYDQDNSGDNYGNVDSGVSDDTGDTGDAGTNDTPSDDNSDIGSDEVIDDNTDNSDTSDSDLGDDTGDTGSDDTVEVY